VPRNVIAKYLGPEKFEGPGQTERSRLRTGVRARQTPDYRRRCHRSSGGGRLDVNRARCCNPLHGEEIIATSRARERRGRHTARCKNVKQLMINPNASSTCEWAAKPEKNAYAVKLLAITRTVPA